MRSFLGMGIVLASLSLSEPSSATALPSEKKRKRSAPVSCDDHPAMPEGGWPESRQVRRARERMGIRQ